MHFLRDGIDYMYFNVATLKTIQEINYTVITRNSQLIITKHNNSVHLFIILLRENEV